MRGAPFRGASMQGNMPRSGPAFAVGWVEPPRYRELLASVHLTNNNLQAYQNTERSRDDDSSATESRGVAEWSDSIPEMPC